MQKVWSEPFNREIIEELQLEAAKRFRHFQLPEAVDEWEIKRDGIVAKLKKTLNLRMNHNLDLDIRYSKPVRMNGYTLTQVIYQSRPGFYVTASLYKPDGDGPFPAVVQLHGHSSDGRLNETYQARASSLCQAGYVEIFVDAFGSGERSELHGEFEYHGGSVGGMLLNIGEPLAGIQIIDNMRAVDMLCSLPYVDKSKIGATGGSGGGNQTMYLAAFDKRVKAAVPVVSVGSYQSYIGGTNCVCELIPDGLEICEESALMAMIAPRALLICNALHDCNKTFYVSEMMRSFDEARKVYRALGASQNLMSWGFNAPHSYPEDVQSLALGFFNYHLKGIGAIQPVCPLPKPQTLPHEKMFFFPRGKRSKLVPSITEHIGRTASELAKNAKGTPAELAKILRMNKNEKFEATYLGSSGEWEKYTIETATGRMLPFLLKRGSGKLCRIYAAPGGKEELEAKGLWIEACESKDSVLVFDPWGCGECGYIEEIQNVWLEQHQLSRALLWLGRRLMGEWTMDYLCAMRFARKQLPGCRIALTGLRDSGVAALYASLFSATESVAMIDSPKTLVRKERAPSRMPPVKKGFEYVPADHFTMALCIPGILAWGDLDHAERLSSAEVERMD